VFVFLDIKDNNGKTAMALLEELCNQDANWVRFTSKNFPI